MNLFSEKGLVRTVEVDPERLYYDSTTEPHHHFFNVDTGELIDIPADGVNLALRTALPEGTETDGVEVVIRVRSALH
jgi:Fur family iron response transcriptional regulator